MVLQVSEQQVNRRLSPSWTKIKDNDMIHTTKSRATCKLGFLLIQQSEPFNKQTASTSKQNYKISFSTSTLFQKKPIDVMNFNSACYLIKFQRKIMQEFAAFTFGASFILN